MPTNPAIIASAIEQAVAVVTMGEEAVFDLGFFDQAEDDVNAENRDDDNDNERGPKRRSVVISAFFLADPIVSREARCFFVDLDRSVDFRLPRRPFRRSRSRLE